MTLENKRKIAELIETARNYNELATAYEDRVFQELHKYISDFSEYNTNAPNADNLDEAISCYIDYGEYTLTDLIDEIEMAINGET